MTNARAIIHANHDSAPYPPVMDVLASQLRAAGIAAELHTTDYRTLPTGWLSEYAHRTVLLVDGTEAERALAILYPTQGRTEDG